jgi:Uma2 family endonuclease
VKRAATHLPDKRLTYEEYLAWAETDLPGRHELVNGLVVAMSPERLRHNRAKLAVALALKNAVRTAGLAFEVFTDGIGVRTGEQTPREPDASVQCGVKADPDSMVLEVPVIVVEVVSPGSGLMDTGKKLVEYFCVASIQHYLIIDPEQGAIIRHARNGDEVRTTFHRGGMIRLEPPGFDLEIDAVIAAGIGKTRGTA